MDAEVPLIRYLYVAGASMAGAITALSFLNWKTMTWPERILTVFVGSSFAFFMTPLLAYRVFGIRIDGDAWTLCALTYAAGTVGNAVVPVIMARARKLAGSWGDKATIEEPKP